MNKRIGYSGGLMHYRVEGDGRPLILLHGFGESGTIWDDQIRVLAQVCRVIIPDLPGSGTSLPCQHHSFETLEDFAALLCALLDAEGIPNCTIIGHSMGGYIALAFADLYPNRLEGFGLFHSTALADSQPRREMRSKGMRFMNEHGASAFLREVIPGLYADTFRASSADMVHKHISETLSWATPEALSGYYRAMMARPDRTRVLADFNGPVLMVLGALDKTVVLEETLPQTNLLKYGHVHILESVAHMGMREDPERSGEILKAFMLGTNKP